MYEVRIQARMNASHQLRDSKGPIEPLHGHDWRIEAVFRGMELDETGCLVDFVEAQEALIGILEPFEGCDLNELWPDPQASISAERVAERIYKLLRHESSRGKLLAAVYVEETPGCIAGYSRAKS